MKKKLTLVFILIIAVMTAVTSAYATVSSSHNYDLSSFQIKPTDQQINNFINSHTYVFPIKVAEINNPNNLYFAVLGSSSPITYQYNDVSDTFVIYSSSSIKELSRDGTITTRTNGTNSYTISSVSLRQPFTTELGEPNTAGIYFSYPPVPVTEENVLLKLQLADGIEKEYQLTANEADSFVNWINGRLNGAGASTYIFTNTQVGPFSERKDYVIYDKVIYFEINKY